MQKNPLIHRFILFISLEERLLIEGKCLRGAKRIKRDIIKTC
jgi:hypothetical protein